MKEIYCCIGLMSGTSRDGVDAALIRTDGEQYFEHIDFTFIPYSSTFRHRLRVCCLEKSHHNNHQAVSAELTQYHIQAVHLLLRGSPEYPIDLIGFHGHTVLHDPENHQTVQIGLPSVLARAVNIPVVARFRDEDIRAGGQGAPLVPLFHRLLVQHHLERPLAILNVGGVSNVTWIGQEENIMAFDVGPGNALIDDWMEEHTGIPLDYNGQVAKTGKIDHTSITTWLKHPFFQKSPPKSLDRRDFGTFYPTHLSLADGAATITFFGVRCVWESLRWFPEAPCHWFVSGGGRLNQTFMDMLRHYLGVPIEPVDKIGSLGDAIEAQAFGFLAVRSLQGLPLTLPTTTGVAQPTTGGQYLTP